MEKKNTILLTVIAIATLLVAVVGATFAYFTASVTTTNQDNNQTTVEAAAIVSASMNMGDKIEVANALPGFTTFKTVDVTGSCRFDDVSKCTDSDAIITLTPSVTDFPNHVKYTLYKKSNKTDSANKDASISCDNINDDGSHKNTNTSGPLTQTTTGEGGEDVTTTVPDVTKYWDAGTCTPDAALETVIATGTFVGTTPVTKTITVSGDTNDTYYLLVEYVNADEAQDAEQGKTFTVDIDFNIGDASTINTTVTKTPGA